MKAASITLTGSLFDISVYIQGFQIVSASIGFDDNIYILLIDETPERIDGMFVQSKTQNAHTYKVLTVGKDFVSELPIYNQRFNYHFVQPFNNDKLLLVGARTRYFNKDKYELNGKLFDLNGVLLKEILLGDGIQSLQVSKNGTIWTGYFDEGVFGNYGWDNPIGASGLIAWNIDGEKIFSNSRANICDCYALNVISDHDVWFYYYSDFKLCNIKDSEIQFFNPGISGSSGFIKYDSYYLFDKGFGKHDKYAFLKSGSFKEQFSIEFTNKDGNKIQSSIRDFRSDKLLLVDNEHVYDVWLRSIIEDLCR
jgi:hypothetical protein